MNVRSLILGLSLLGLSSAAVAAAPACVPVIDKAWVRAAPPGAMMLAGYAIVRNPCARAFAITGLSASDFSLSMIHETRVENGVSKMRHAGPMSLPAHGELRFEPGAGHLMLMNPKHALKIGDRLKLTIKLGDGTSIDGEFPIRAEPPK
jgi:copper(I)-binding protein